MVTPTINLFSMLLYNCNFAIFMNLNVNSWYANGLRRPCDRAMTHRLSTTVQWCLTKPLEHWDLDSYTVTYCYPESRQLIFIAHSQLLIYWLIRSSEALHLYTDTELIVLTPSWDPSRQKLRDNFHNLCYQSVFPLCVKIERREKRQFFKIFSLGLGRRLSWQCPCYVSMERWVQIPSRHTKKSGCQGASIGEAETGRSL